MPLVEHSLDRIATALEALVVLHTPKDTDVKAQITENFEAIMDLNPMFRTALESITKLNLNAGDDSASNNR